MLIVDDRLTPYSDIVFALQKLMYDYQESKMILVYSEYLGMILAKATDAYEAYLDFLPEFSNILLEMIQAAEGDLKALSDLARATNNSLMIKSFQQIRAFSNVGAPSAAALSFFTHASLSSALPSSMPPKAPRGGGPG